MLKACFNTTQQLLAQGKLLAGHDISDGGIATAVRGAPPALPGLYAPVDGPRRRVELVLAGMKERRGQSGCLLPHRWPSSLHLCTPRPHPYRSSSPPPPTHPLQILEMAFAGNCGVSVDLPAPAADPHGALAALFAEELGLVLEVAPEDEAAVLAAYAAAGVPAAAIGATASGQDVSLSVGGARQVGGTTPALRDVWEATSFQLERLQAAEECVEAEEAGLAGRTAPAWRVPFTPAWTPADKLAATGARACSAAALAWLPSTSRLGSMQHCRVLLACWCACVPRPPAASPRAPHPPPAAPPADKVKVAIIREEGSNGDREMAAAVRRRAGRGGRGARWSLPGLLSKAASPGVPRLPRAQAHRPAATQTSHAPPAHARCTRRAWSRGTCT